MDEHGKQREPSGPIAWMAGHGVAANMLMLAIVAAGLVSVTGLEREAWPTLPFNHIEVAMSFPGATPEEVEESIVVKIEEQVRALDNVIAVKSVAAPGAASVRVEVATGTDIDRALDDVESAIGRIQTFPDGAGRPQVTEMTNRQSIIRLVVYGDVAERTLKEVANWIEDELTALPAVSLVNTSGVRDYEISIEVPLQRLRALGLTLADVATAVRRGSLDLSGGTIATEAGEVRVRTLGQRDDQYGFEEIVVLTGGDGTRVWLGDIARVRDDFEDTGLIVRHEGQPAAFVEIHRGEGEQVMDVATAVREHLEDAVLPALPHGIGLAVWNDESRTYSERVDLLVKNGVLGLVLVFVALALFLEIRLAVWVGAGLAVTFIGALAVMLALDIAINTISLFVFVLAIGIIVDDAIVVAEHVHAERRKGVPGLAAAIRGARRIKVPLTFAVLTSVAAFTPLLFIPGGIGEIWRPLPVIIIAMLLISLVESLFIMPNHLSSLHGPEWSPCSSVDRFFARTQGLVDEGMRRFIAGPLDRALHFATGQPLVTLAGAVGLLIVSVSLLPAGVVATTFADIVEGDFVTASLEMPDGTTAERTYAVARDIELAGRRVVDRLEEEEGTSGAELLTGVTVTVGQGPRVEGGGVIAAPTLNPEANIATIDFKLVSAQERSISTDAVARAWRNEVGILPNVRGVTFTGEVLNLGNAVAAVLSHPDPERLARTADAVVNDLQGVQGVFDVRSHPARGVREVQLRLRPEARVLGVTLEDIAQQTRDAFFGAEALRVQRGGEDVRVYVRLPSDERDAITDVERYVIRTPAGEEVPLSRVAALESGMSPPTLQRLDGRRVVTITAEVDATVISSTAANAVLTDSILAEYAAADPNLSYTYGGEQQQQIESLGSLYRGFAMAMLAIFALLAIPLRSYTKPLIVMAIIPFGLIGVILGHLILGVPFSATAIMGILGLSGVVVNDSLVMIDFIDQRLREGAPPRDAIIEGAKGRFRPIALTSVTTFLGFTPLILERAIQAQFLMPFAASLGIGIVITTAILMMVVPAMYAIRVGLLSAPRPGDGMVAVAAAERSA